METVLRRARSRKARARLTVESILAWADEHEKRHGQWPTTGSGRVKIAADKTIEETWRALDRALRRGSRGLAGGSSLSLLLADHGRGAGPRPPLSIDQILAWADAHHLRTGAWPQVTSGQVVTAPRETWSHINICLRTGARGLPGGMTLGRLLTEYRQVPRQPPKPPLTVEQIVQWIKEHRLRTGEWPRRLSGPVPGQPRETWSRIDQCLLEGRRGLPGRSSIAVLVKSLTCGPLTIERILQWADAHYARTGKWPRTYSGRVLGERGENWQQIGRLLRIGGRGLPGGTTLVGLLQKERTPRPASASPHRPVREPPTRPIPERPSRPLREQPSQPPLTIKQILAWMDAHRAATGRWPTTASGRVLDAPSETWIGIATALKRGQRGLPQSSLAQLRSEAGRVNKCVAHISRGRRVWACHRLPKALIR